MPPNPANIPLPVVLAGVWAPAAPQGFRLPVPVVFPEPLSSNVTDALMDKCARFIGAFECPITQQVMLQPAIAQDGHTYEHDAIEEWLDTSNRSPITRATIGRFLAPNYALRSLMISILQEWEEEDPDP